MKTSTGHLKSSDVADYSVCRHDSSGDHIVTEFRTLAEAKAIAEDTVRRLRQTVVIRQAGCDVAELKSDQY